ncbi:MAG: uracil-DNA glycosylase [Deltaproteobacteria bacterium]|nr:uracil-DNA glycosylase [Deltaproteobacteria bacterium]
MANEHFDKAALKAAIGGWYDCLSAPVIESTIGIVHSIQALRDGGIVVYPAQQDMFRALRMTQPDQVKCVILGQDPYHGAGQANGLAFSVPDGCPLPPSLRNIYKELSADMGCPVPRTGDLSGWAQQGVLLLNSILTVEEKKPGKHARFGWQKFTESVIRASFLLPQPVAFLVWGKSALDSISAVYGEFDRPPEKKGLFTTTHPSPLSAYRGFFGSRTFTKGNCFLTENGAAPVKWDVLL